jgi:hypothetical protein
MMQPATCHEIPLSVHTKKYTHVSLCNDADFAWLRHDTNRKVTTRIYIH